GADEAEGQVRVEVGLVVEPADAGEAVRGVGGEGREAGGIVVAEDAEGAVADAGEDGVQEWREAFDGRAFVALTVGEVAGDAEEIDGAVEAFDLVGEPLQEDGRGTGAFARADVEVGEVEDPQADGFRGEPEY